MGCAESKPTVSEAAPAAAAELVRAPSAGHLPVSRQASIGKHKNAQLVAEATTQARWEQAAIRDRPPVLSVAPLPAAVGAGLPGRRRRSRTVRPRVGLRKLAVSESRVLLL